MPLLLPRYDELLGMIAPRPTLLYTPQGDCDATYTDVLGCVTAATAAWAKHGATDKLTHTAPDAITKMEQTEVTAAIDWLNSL